MFPVVSEPLLMNRKQRLENAAPLADDYLLTHKDSFDGKPYQSFSLSHQDPSSSSSQPPASTGNWGKDDSQREKFDNESHPTSRSKPPISRYKPSLPSMWGVRELKTAS